MEIRAELAARENSTERNETKVFFALVQILKQIFEQKRNVWAAAAIAVWAAIAKNEWQSVWL